MQQLRRAVPLLPYPAAILGLSSSVLLKLPVSIVQRTDLPCLQPTRDAVEVKCVLHRLRSVVLTCQEQLVTVRCRFPTPPCTPRSWQMPDWPGIRCLTWVSASRRSTDRKIVQRSMMWFRQMAQLSTTMSQAQRATAFHYRGSAGRDDECWILHAGEHLFHFEPLLGVGSCVDCTSFASLDHGLALDRSR